MSRSEVRTGSELDINAILNNTEERPEPVTEDNDEAEQVDTNEANANEVNFKVQIGTYRVNLTEKVASLFFELAKKHGLDHYVNASGAKAYTIGAFKNCITNKMEKILV